MYVVYLRNTHSMHERATCKRGLVTTQRNISGDRILTRVVDFKQNLASFFATFDSLVVLTTRSDVYILRPGDFRADNDDRRLLCTLRMRAR